MRRFVMKLIAALTVLFSLNVCCSAEDTPLVEIFGGYAFDLAALRVQAPGGANIPPADGNFYGWNASLTLNPNSWLGIVVDASGLYGRLSSSSIILLPPPCAPCSQPFNHTLHRMYTVAAGPQVAMRRQKLTVFAHGLVGEARTTEDVPAPNTFLLTARQTDSSIAFIGGGGADIGISQHFALRVQPDYLRTKPVSGTHNGLRLAIGIVARLGER